MHDIWDEFSSLKTHDKLDKPWLCTEFGNQERWTDHTNRHFFKVYFALFSGFEYDFFKKYLLIHDW